MVIFIKKRSKILFFGTLFPGFGALTHNNDSKNYLMCWENTPSFRCREDNEVWGYGGTGASPPPQLPFLNICTPYHPLPHFVAAPPPPPAYPQSQMCRNTCHCWREFLTEFVRIEDRFGHLAGEFGGVPDISTENPPRYWIPNFLPPESSAGCYHEHCQLHYSSKTSPFQGNTNSAPHHTHTYHRRGAPSSTPRSHSPPPSDSVFSRCSRVPLNLRAFLDWIVRGFRGSGCQYCPPCCNSLLQCLILRRRSLITSAPPPRPHSSSPYPARHRQLLRLHRQCHRVCWGGAAVLRGRLARWLWGRMWWRLRVVMLSSPHCLKTVPPDQITLPIRKISAFLNDKFNLLLINLAPGLDFGFF